jgi:hypothetical protein
VSAPTTIELQTLVQRISERIGRHLERRAGTGAYSPAAGLLADPGGHPALLYGGYANHQSVAAFEALDLRSFGENLFT